MVVALKFWPKWDSRVKRGLVDEGWTEQSRAQDTTDKGSGVREDGRISNTPF